MRQEEELRALHRARARRGCSSQVRGARKTLRNAPGKLQSGRATQRACELGRRPREIKLQAFAIHHVGANMTITVRNKIPPMKN